ncbi:unnamed protein product [Rotaria sordida]|uniref:Uncharacterized protein n=1 Tax=Rotaria sordida TaxID=392033 RepID=A0A815M0M5_9BILA|nr:unnamed protein product [Rotaria sordida]CAF1166585.1 unnamed protein product [Rotaria sordida]CAF1167614.1 unnamed protein product [Rotaria sordida]CAF1418031.1 unnamed protein product [Rotaria sordida]CAF1419427.1 unnamed protein product [Rotaria sordida]
MSLSCDTSGTNCKRFSSNTTNGNNTVLGLVLGSIASLIVVILIVIITYMVHCKGYFRKRLQCRLRGGRTLQNQELSDQQQPQVNSQESSNKLSPSYQETNKYDNVMF